jgi:transposase
MQYNIGIDIGKFEFVRGIYGQKDTKTYSNDETGIALFIKEHEAILPEALTVVETTGGFEIKLIKAMLNEKYVVHRAPGRQIKNFIRSFGQYTKTDAIDALAIARYAKERGDSLPCYVLPSENKHSLSLYVTRQMDLKKMLVQEKNRKKAPLNVNDARIQASIDRIIEFIKAEILTLDALIKGLVTKDENVTKILNELQTVDGIGPITGVQLYAFFPELGTLTGKEIASLGGVAPHMNQSGKKTGYASTKGGRRDLRPILFLAALGAIRKKTGALAAWYQQLIARGKKPLVALVAVARKILVIANARIRDYYKKKGAAIQTIEIAI